MKIRYWVMLNIALFIIVLLIVLLIFNLRLNPVLKESKELSEEMKQFGIQLELTLGRANSILAVIEKDMRSRVAALQWNKGLIIGQPDSMQMIGDREEETN